MSKGWFNDSIRTFEGKEASELLQGVRLVEISELDAFRKTDTARIKQFLSCCVFFGITNTSEFLQDRTGNRRFWPVDVGIADHTKNVWDGIDDEIDQVWAEAVTRWKIGEKLHLIGELENKVRIEQELHLLNDLQVHLTVLCTDNRSFIILNLDFVVLTLKLPANVVRCDRQYSRFKFSDQARKFRP